VSEVANTLPISSCETPNTIVSDTPVLCTTHDTPVVNVVSNTTVAKLSPALPTLYSFSTSPVSHASVSYVYGSGPPPLIQRVPNSASPILFSLAGDPSVLLPSLSTLNLGFSS